jgi:hypothetical protein
MLEQVMDAAKGSRMSGRRISLALAALVLAGSGGALAQESSEVLIAETLTVEGLECIPGGEHQLVSATAEGLSPSVRIRIYFRRLNPEGSFYYVAGHATDAESVWGTLPKPKNEGQQELTDEWWAVLKTRDWMQYRGRNRQWLEDWLEQQSDEAAEVFAALVDADGRMLERSEVQLVPVRHPDQCTVTMDPVQAGEANNLTVGETDPIQADRELFHWQCDGVVTRMSPEEILKADTACRGCVSGSG